jgi:hypothetical protein
MAAAGRVLWSAEMAKDFDTAGKHLFDRHPRAWLALLGWPVPPTDDGVTVVDSDLSTVSRAADKLVRVDGVAVPYVAHVEFQTSGGPALDGRMLEYNVLARGRHDGRPVRSVAFLFRPTAAAGPTGRVDEQADEHCRLLFTYRLFRLWELPTADVLAGPLGTVPLAPLTATPAELPAVVEATRQRVWTEAPRAVAEVMLECARVLLGLRFDPDQREPLMPSLQRLIEEESWVYQDTVKKGMADGIALGVAQGIAQGVAQGVAQGRHEQLLELGTVKFGPPDDATVAQLNAITDIDRLRRLGRRLLTVQTWAELLAEG